MLRTFHRKTAWAVAAAGALVILSASQSLAAAGWTIVAAPPTGQNATLTSVAAVSGSRAWAVGFHSGNAFTNVGAKALIDRWNGTAWSSVTAPVTPGNTALLLGVSASSATDAWAVGRTQDNKSSFEGLALHWNGRAWSAVTLPLPANAHSNTTLDAISARGRGDVWIVGTFLDSATRQNETFSEHFDGTAWRIVPSPSPGTIGALSGVATSNARNSVWAVGESGPAGSFNSLVLRNG